MKPLELYIYPPHPKCLNLNGAPDYYCELRHTEWDDELDWSLCWGCKWYWLGDNSKAKHLTPSECAAEYFNNLASHGVFAGGRRSGKTLQMNRTHALYRFATLPHAAEKDYE